MSIIIKGYTARNTCRGRDLNKVVVRENVGGYVEVRVLGTSRACGRTMSTAGTT